MNKIHNVIWSKAKNAWVVVSEGSRSCSKAGSGAVKVIIALIMLSPAAGMAATLPQGGSITVGQGTITTDGANQMVIKQTTDKLGINWQSFNVGADGHVIFDQPGAHSIALNRVIGSDGSSILGKIDANGQVFLINPNGVIFGKDSKVNVGGLVASTMNMTDSDFVKGDFKFAAGVKNGEIQNLGVLQAAEGGYIALLGRTVKNQGIIQAKLGTAALASGDSVTLDFSGDGLINIQVDRSTIDAMASNQGLIQADGGNVLLTARSSNALLDTVVNNEGVIQAQTISSRSGKIFLDGGFEGGVVNVAGSLDASAPTAGSGGFIETSGAQVRIASGVKVTTLSSKGTTGTWLIDPTDFNIEAGSGSQTVNTIGADTLAASLSASNVALATSALSTDGQTGNLNVNADVSWNANTTLTLSAHNDVNINAKILVNGDTGGIVLNPTGRVNTSNYGSVKLNGAHTTYTENGSVYKVLRTVDDLNQLASASASNQKFVLGGDIDASIMSTWDGGKGFLGYGDYDSTYTAISGATLNGLGNTIFNFYTNRPTDHFVGLFGAFYNGTLSNLTITGTAIGGNNTGLLAGEVHTSTIYNVNSSGLVQGDARTGGLFGEAYISSIDHARSAASITGSGRSVGGVIGYSHNNKYITDLEFSGDVAGGTYVGGVIGESSSDQKLKDLETSSSTTVSGGNRTGGVLGSVVLATQISDLSGSGSVSGTTSVGGAIGYMQTQAVKASNLKSDATVNGDSKVGGLVGEMYVSTLSNAFATGNVTGSGTSVGGLVGWSQQSIVDSVLSTGHVTGGQDVGGLFGTSNYDQIKTSFSVSSAHGDQNVGGFIGNSVQSIIIDAYATGEASADTANSGGFVGKSYYTNYKNTYSTGLVSSSGASGKGGFLGSGTSDVFTKSYWDMDRSGMSSSAGGAIGKHSGEMTSSHTYEGWGISTTGEPDANPWRIYEGYSSPLLKFAMGTADITGKFTETTYNGQDLNFSVEDLFDVSNLVRNEFFSPLKNLGSGDFQGGYAGLKNAGERSISDVYSDQFGLNINQIGSSTLNVKKAKLELVATADGKVYDGTTNVYGLTISDNRFGDDSFYITYNASYTDKNAGDDKQIRVTSINIAGLDAYNYTWDFIITTTSDVAKADLGLTASGGSKVYDGTTAGSADFTYHSIGGDVIGVSGTAKFSDKNAGYDKDILVTDIEVTGDDAKNYTWNSTLSTKGDIEQAYLNIGGIAKDKVYDGTANAELTITDDRVRGDDLNISSDAHFVGVDMDTSQPFLDKNAGDNKFVLGTNISVSGADAQNYYWDNSPIISTANISKADLSLSATAAGKVYDGNRDAAVSVTDGRILGDDLNISYSSFFDDKNAGSNKSITIGDLVVTGADAGNYTWSEALTTTADIEKASLYITADGVGKAYDGSNFAKVNFSDSRVDGDDLVISGNSNFTDKNAGAGKEISVSDLTVSGSDAGNYVWNSSATTSADIDKANLVLSADNAGKAAGSSGSKLTWKIEEGHLFGSDVITGNLSREAGEQAGSYMINQGSLDAGSNYSLVVRPGEFVISKPTVNKGLEDTKEVVSAISSSSTGHRTISVTTDSKASVEQVAGSGYGLLNLGMKLPDDLLRDEI